MIFQMLGATGINFNLRSNELVEIKIESDIMLQDLKILGKFVKIFTLVTSTNPDLAN